MGYEYRNLSQVLAQGFLSVYTVPKAKEEERQGAIGALADIFEERWVHGYNHGQMAFAEQLVKAVDGKPGLSAQEILSLASQLQRSGA